MSLQEYIHDINEMLEEAKDEVHSEEAAEHSC